MRLTKHHGLGNDFLVLLDLDDGVTVDGETARALCDRHYGVGADGIIRVGAGRDGSDVTMHLLNADGSPAEISGNGARCLGQALAMDREADSLDVTVLTPAGVRRVTIRPGDAPHTVWGSVDLGPAKVRTIENLGIGERQAEVDLGNPHLVILDDEGSVELTALGRRYPDRNVELIRRGPGSGSITMAVWERGVGQTLACGSGAGAAAAAARDWGLAGDEVTVHMSGGDAVVALSDTVLLSGPSVYIATIEVPWP